MEYRIGLDIGIGSVGWAVVSAADETHPARIEDFGTRIFDSGENKNSRESNCQQRRGYRSVRRLERRNAHRKELLLQHFEKIGLMNQTFQDELADCKDEDIFSLKVKALAEAITPAELFRCMVHTSNHRGYRDFYEPTKDSEDQEATVNAAAANAFERAFRDSHLRTVSEYLLACYSDGDKVVFRNRKNGDGSYTLIRRGLLAEEAEAILNTQKQYHSALTDDAIQKILGIIFQQRDFEDGPGDPNDTNRKYHGFLEALGRCTYYTDEKRGFRGTVISDVYAVTNTLSQYRFVCEATGECYLDKAVAKELVDALLNNANLTITDVKRILKQNGFKLYKSANSDDNALKKSIKFLRQAKARLGDRWESVISEEQFDLECPSQLHRIGELLSTYQTPKRREKEMRAAGIDASVIKAFSGIKLSGTSNVSYRYMVDAIRAFLDGDIYGNFQANTIREHAVESPVQRSFKLKPCHIDDPEVRSNRVVFKAINETRKIINAIIDIYGSPSQIVVEVANELGKSFAARSKEERRQKANEKANDADRKYIAELLGINVEDVRGEMIERLRLFRLQDGKCMYSGKDLGELAVVLKNQNKEYETDHIIPYSLVLDNTLDNKALVFISENQYKGQRSPLMYMSAEQQKAFRATVNYMYSRKENAISKKKHDYLLLESIYGPEAKEIMEAWKSRNINDTRYITKYICGIFNKYLIFAGDENKRHVFPVKGSVTQKFRREWLRTLKWGDEIKDRNDYLNHAIDAVVAANLTLPYIEIGSDALRLRSLYYEGHKKFTSAYNDYLSKCVVKMKKYYGFQEEYTRQLLKNPERIPSYVPRLSEEINCRMQGASEEKFNEEEFINNVQNFYGVGASFIVQPHRPIASLKQERKFSGAICDDNPIKIVFVDGIPHKVSKKLIQNISVKDLPHLYSNDPKLYELLAKILLGKEEGYSIENYMKENGLKAFRDAKGRIIRKVSILEQSTTSNYYLKNDKGGTQTYLSGLKYYCIEIYQDHKGRTKTCGIRFVDLVKKSGKLYRKAESLPADYNKHVMYLFKNEFIRVLNNKGDIKFEGFYQSVETIGRSEFSFKAINQIKRCVQRISLKDTVQKIDISLLGHRGGVIKCSEPLPCIEAKK